MLTTASEIVLNASNSKVSAELLSILISDENLIMFKIKIVIHRTSQLKDRNIDKRKKITCNRNIKALCGGK